MGADSGRGDGKNLSISIGKEIDRSLAEIVTALLKPAATEIGRLLGDSIGLVSDRIHQKREINASIGLGEVRKKLEASGVAMENITPPKEEELHLLINGLSLSDDESLRDLWAGLFAKALNPDSSVTAERPLLSVLQSLSPLDAKIIDFLAFTIKTDAELKRKASIFFPKDFKSLTPEEVEKLDQVRKEHSSLLKSAIQSVRDRASSYGFDKISDEGWSDNLLRQGIIERVPDPFTQFTSPSLHRSSLSPRLDESRLLAIISDMARQVENISRAVKQNTSPPKRILEGEIGAQVQLEVRFTSFGRRLAEACGLL